MTGNNIYKKLTVSHTIKLFLVLLIIFSTVLPSLSPANVLALTAEQKKVFQSGVLYFDVEAGSANCIGATILSGSTPSNSKIDYAGNQILTDAQLQQITANQSIYEQASKQVDIPWQMLATIHLKEHGLKKDNPSNGQGIYQFVNGDGGPYPTGSVDDAEFLRQTILAAEFIKGKAVSNYPPNQVLDSNSSPETIKDTFYGYNGRAYALQATSIGYDGATQAYEGSPYVMTKADAIRDPTVNTTSWGQIKVDFGPIEYPANNSYGAFVIYGALAGISSRCGASGTLVWPEAKSLAITSCYGNRVHPVTGEFTMHYGLDMAGGSGTPILAAAGGTVVFAGLVDGYGPNFVVIEHNTDIGSSYGHMSSMSVKNGDNVSQGQQIGTEGDEGIGTGTHLHFNVFKGKYLGNDSNNVNPLQNGLTIAPGVANTNNCN